MGTDIPPPNLGGYGPFQPYACQAPNGWLSGNLWTTRGVCTWMGGGLRSPRVGRACPPTGRRIRGLGLGYFAGTGSGHRPCRGPGSGKVLFPLIRRPISVIRPSGWYRFRSGAVQRSLTPAQPTLLNGGSPIQPRGIQRRSNQRLSSTFAPPNVRPEQSIRRPAWSRRCLCDFAGALRAGVRPPSRRLRGFSLCRD